jgi:hypothetical protein
MASSILLTQAAIARCAKISQPMISMVLRGDRTPSVDVAVRLEACTGVCREAWLFPDRHFNPYQPICDSGFCSTCPNRVTRVKFVGERLLEYLKTTDSRRTALKHACKWFHIHIGYSEKTVKILWAEIIAEGFLLICQHGGPPLPDFVPKELLPSLHLDASKGMVEAVKHIPDDYPLKVSKEDRDFARRLGIRHALYISVGRTFNALVSTDSGFHWSEELLDYLHSMNKRMDELLAEDDYK